MLLVGGVLLVSKIYEWQQKCVLHHLLAKFIVSISCRNEDMHTRCRVPPCGSNYLVHLISVFYHICLGLYVSQT